MWQRCEWLNEPKRWSLDGDRLSVVTDAAGDFWRETAYGYTRDSGHMFGAGVAGDFTADLAVEGAFSQLYDQAGLMVRIDAAHWVKFGVETYAERMVLSSVLSVGRSDWAVGPELAAGAPFRLRATVLNGALRLYLVPEDATPLLVRLAAFPSASAYRVGPMCCTPERGGLQVVFRDFRIGAPEADTL